MSRIFAIVFNIFFFCFFQCYGQWDLPQLQNFPDQPLPNDRVNAIGQDSKGLMYFGKDGGLLTYDGNTWTNVKFSNSEENVEDVKCLGNDKSGQIIAGCRKTIGLVKNQANSLEEYEIKYTIEPKWGDPGKIISSGDFIYVWFTDEKILRLNANTYKKDWLFKEKMELIFSLKQNVYCFKSGVGLFVVKGNQLVSVSISDYWKSKTIRMAALDGETILLGSNDGKIGRFDGKNIETLEFQGVNQYLSKGIFDGVVLPDKKIFIALLTEGGIVLDLKTENLVRPVNTRYGLAHDDIYSCLSGKFGGLWLAHGNGISRIWAYSPIEDYKSVSGFKSRIISIASHKNELLVVTEDGLYELVEGNSGSVLPVDKQENRLKINYLPAQRKRFVKIKSIPDVRIYSVKKAENSWIIGSNKGLYEWDGKTTKTIIAHEYVPTFIIPQKHQDIILAVSGAELKIFQKSNGNWKKINTIEKVKTIIFSLAEERNGRIWAGTESGAAVLDFNNNFKKEPKILYNGKKTRTDVMILFGRPFLFNGTSISSFVAGKFQNESYDKDKKRSTILKQFVQKKAIIHPSGDNVIVYSQGITFLLKKKDQSYEVDTLFPESSFATNVEEFFTSEDGTVFAALKDRVIKFSIKEIEKLHRNNFPCIIRQVNFKQNKTLGLEISSDKFVEIEFAGLNFDNDDAIHYQFFLDGNMDDWGNWQKSNKVNFNGLSPGTYTFFVRAVNAYGQLSNTASYTFRISPPWYLTWWAYIIYFLLAVGLIYLIILFRIKVLEDQKKYLEALIQERTSDIENKNEELKLSMETIQNQQEQLVQSEKMAALGSIVANTAHELNTPIGAIKNSISSIHESLPNAFQKLPELSAQLKPEDQLIFYQYIQQLIKNPQSFSGAEALDEKTKLQEYLTSNKLARTERMAEKMVSAGLTSNLEAWVGLLKSYPALQNDLVELIFQFGKFANNMQVIELAAEKTRKKVLALKVYTHTGHEEKSEKFDLVENIETVFTIYNNYFKNDIKLIRNYEVKPSISGWSDNLMQVWTNLIFNAIQAMGGKGELQVHIVEQDSGYLVKIQDSGPGIPPDVMKKIFTPLFTTKAKGEGTGLGLSICQKMIEKHQGKLSVSSEPGKTIFAAWLPKELINEVKS